ncbi:MAG: glycosyltransferase family 4 protein [Armatimonadota bacterium]
MKILFLASWFPYPPDNGAKIRTYYLLKALCEKEDIHLVSLYQEEPEQEHLNHIKNICSIHSLHKIKKYKPNTIKSLLGYFSTKPRSFIDTYDKKVANAVDIAAKDINPDVIIVSTMGMVDYIPKNTNTLLVLEQHNCEYAILKRAAEKINNPIKKLKAELGWKKYSKWEYKVCSWFDVITEVSNNDKILIQKIAKRDLNIEVIPNGVETSIYDYDNWDPDINTIIYNGALTYSANYYAVKYYADEIYPLLKNKYPNLKLYVTGKTDSVDVSYFENHNGIILTGYIKSMPEILKKSSACIVPLKDGGGSRLKILEAMAQGVPVVSSSIGIEGINAHNNKEVLIADNPNDFSNAIDKILNDKILVSELRANARKLVVENYDWKIIGNKFVEVIYNNYKIKHSTGN